MKQLMLVLCFLVIFLHLHWCINNAEDLIFGSGDFDTYQYDNDDGLVNFHWVLIVLKFDKLLHPLQNSYTKHVSLSTEDLVELFKTEQKILKHLISLNKTSNDTLQHYLKAIDYNL